MDELAQFTTAYHSNISDVTESNNYFRRVIATTPNMQLVVMSIKPGEDIGYEIHPYITQFFRIEQGEGVAIVDGVAYNLRKDIALVVPLNTEHNIINTSSTESLKLYTIYTPPNHRYNKIDVTKPPSSEH
jgi:mannose-6-phosphate isomerase-like protein (cupin superfamily)